MQDIKQPTFFIRAVRSEEELSFIEENREYIYTIVKKENLSNEIAFLILNGMKKPSNNIMWFRLSVERYLKNIYELRMLFDLSSDFSEYCMKHILPQESIIHNKEFDKEHNKTKIGRGMLVHSLKEYSDDVVLALKEYYPNISGGYLFLGSRNVWYVI